MFHRVSSPSKRVLTAQEPQFYRGKHEVDRRSRLVTLKYKGYCWSGCYTVAESVGQQSFNSALGMAQIMGQIIGPATGNARLVRYEEQGLTKPAIYAFLGLATLPRFRGRADGPHPRAANPLHLLPREIVRHIARFAYRDRYHAHWIMFGNPFTRLAAVAIDVTNGTGGSATSLPSMRSGKTYYVEVSFTQAWWGTSLEIFGVYGAPTGGQRFRFVLNNNIPGGGAAYTGHIACFKSGLASTPMLSIPSLGVNSWSYCEAPVTLSVLVDMVRGCATFGLNGLAGPCVRFPGEGWRNGVHVQARGFPVPAVLEGARCILSCATPPTPPAILAAASHPMTVAEHLAAGSLREEANLMV